MTFDVILRDEKSVLGGGSCEMVGSGGNIVIDRGGGVRGWE